MRQTNQQLIRKFEIMARWMVEDTSRAMFQARANFLVAQGLLNYTEVVGSFINPNGNSGERFDTFFRRMGNEYGQLLRRFNGRRRRNPHIVYDDLRCGLTHEYAIKRKKFIVYNVSTSLSDAQINTLGIPINGVMTMCVAGVMHSRDGSKSVWHFVDPKYWLDFKNALDVYIGELNTATDPILVSNFITRARQVNFTQFVV